MKSPRPVMMNDRCNLKSYSIMNKSKTGYLIVSLVLIQCLASAQLPDGVTATQSFLNAIVSNYAEENSVSFDLNTINTQANIPIRVHIIMNIKGLPGVTPGKYYQQPGSGKHFFRNAGIRFFIDPLIM